MTSVRENRTCLACAVDLPAPFLSLGDQVPANAFALTPDAVEEKFPLAVTLCPKCKLCQLTHIVDRAALFTDYAYFSSTSPQLLGHFRGYADEILKRFSPKLVVEIASNDGILLKPLKAGGVQVLGIDPAKNIALEANLAGIETIPSFFDADLAKRVVVDHGYADVVVANNVLAHTDDLNAFVRAAKSMLAPWGVLIVEVGYLGDLLDNGDFTNIYHEHVAYFSLESLCALFDRTDLLIFDVERVPTQGGSLRVYASHSENTAAAGRVSTFIAYERERGLGRSELYTKFAADVPRTRLAILELLASVSRVAAYGASAKGSVLLQYCGLTAADISYVTDEAPSKQGRHMPGSGGIPIVPTSTFRKKPPTVALVTAWNYADNIIAKERWFTEAGGKFVVPLPKLRVI